MNRVILAVVGVVMLVGSALAGDDSLRTYLQVNILEGHHFAYEASGTEGTCCLEYGKACIESYYRKGRETGINVGGTAMGGPQGANYELNYSLSMTREEDQDVLIGSVYSLDLTPEGTITGGRKINIRRPIQYDRADTIAVSDSVGIEWLVQRRLPGEYARKVYGPLMLISVQEYDGTVRSVAGNASGLDQEHTFRGGFSIPSEDQFEETKRLATISFSKSPENAVYPLACTLTFEREYLIDTLLYPGAEFHTDVEYTSKYVKEITLQPGKVTQLVFPPDSPSVRGFDITDTLIISPPAK